ncbi:Acetyl-coenzyme A carboxylase carboxyl transferase subunit alpha, chloroplastic, partial [Tetrabaena socialis]
AADFAALLAAVSARRQAAAGGGGGGGGPGGGKEVPEDFLDPITSAIMADPVVLPDSQVSVDRATIERHFLTSLSDPFSRTPLTREALKPNVQLRDKIQEWLATPRNGGQASPRLPPDTPKEGPVGREWLGTILSRFGPVKEKVVSPTTLEFEKPLLELDKRIKEVRKVAEENGVDVTASIAELETRARQLRKETYSRLTPVQRLQVARHPNRPTCLDIILNITDKFVELHGDRGGLDDPAIVCGIGSINGTPFMMIGHQKGRNTKGEAIAFNLREMFGLRVPIISCVIGEGGSGGALAIGCANRNLIMENAVYYVASPEAVGAHTKAGTWAASEAEAHYIEQMVDADEKWDKLLAEGAEWLNKPVQPPGLARSGARWRIMDVAVSMVEARRQKQQSAAGGAVKASSPAVGAAV